MFTYYLQLAIRDLKRSPSLTVLVILSIGVGVALAMSTWTLVHTMSGDPIPQKSADLYFPTIDAWGPAARAAGDTSNGEPPNMLDYGTAHALLRDHRAKYQSANYWIQPTIVPSRHGEHPFTVSGFAVTDQFFPMLDVPFKYGAGWSAADETGRAQVAVISERLNDKLFGGGDSVGKAFTIGHRSYQVVGVLKHWNPQPTYYDVPAFGGFMIRPTEIYLPFATAVAAQVGPQGGDVCFKSPLESGFSGLLRSSCVWISYMAELDSPAAARNYEDYLKGFARQRFEWPPNIRLRGLMAWLNYLHVVPSSIRILRYVGIGLLIVCLVDTIGLMLAKFLRRAGEIGIRRALGAPRRAIYAQFLTEAAVIGIAGGIVGLILTSVGMLWLRTQLPSGWSALTGIDAGLLILTVVIAIIATLVAAWYPTWRAARVQPALHLRGN